MQGNQTLMSTKMFDECCNARGIDGIVARTQLALQKTGGRSGWRNQTWQEQDKVAANAHGAEALLDCSARATVFYSGGIIGMIEPPPGQPNETTFQLTLTYLRLKYSLPKGTKGSFGPV